MLFEEAIGITEQIIMMQVKSLFVVLRMKFSKNLRENQQQRAVSSRQNIQNEQRR